MDPLQRLEMEMVKDSLIKALPSLMGAYPVIAEATKSYYDNLVAVGFKKDQALEIIKTQGIMAGIPIPEDGGDNK